MSIRPLRKEEMLAIKRLDALCYNVPYNEKEVLNALDKQENPEKGYWGFFNDQNLLESAVGCFTYDVFYQGKACKMAGIGGVVTSPEARRGGKVRQLLGTALKEAYDKDCLFSTLYPFSHAFYEKFGYTLMNQQTNYKVPVDAFIPFAQKNTKIWSSQADTKKDIDDLVAFTDQFHSHFTIAAVSNQEYWKKTLPENPYDHGTYTYLIGEEGSQRPNAFIRFSSRFEEKEKNMFVSSLAFSSREGLQNCFAFFSAFFGQFRHVVFSLPTQVPVREMLSDPYRVEVFSRELPMGRVINPEKVLALLASKHPSLSLTIKVVDPFFSFAQGCWSIVQGEVKQNTASQADCTMSIQSFSQVAMGALTFRQVVYKPDILFSGEIANFEKLFSCNPFYLTDTF
ncbi:MAG: GNAT family N-acetyltransferase [Clostridiales bacterium]|nr:GNAT family N-acetyltransferase [Clostridiales bacterium]